MMWRAVWCAGACVALVSACADPTRDPERQGGDSVDGYFQITPAPADTPLVAGGSMDWRVVDYEATLLGASATPRAVQAADPDVLRLDGVRGAVITTTGERAGQTTVSFTGDADGDALRDALRVRVVQPVSVQLAACPAGGVYLRGLPARLDRWFVSADGEAAYGWGYEPLALWPVGAASVMTDRRDPLAVWLDIASDAGERLEVRSALAADEGSAAVLELLDASQVTGVALQNTNATLIPGQPTPLVLAVRAGQRPVCTTLEARVTVETPDTCQVIVDGVALTSVSAFMRDVALEGTQPGAWCYIKVAPLAAALPGRYAAPIVARFQVAR
jgi:hypothetical protein